MFELNILRRRRQRLRICNRSAGRDRRTAVNSIQTWLGQIEGWMLPLFEQQGGGKAKGGIDRISVPPPKADHRAGGWGGYLQGSSAGGPALVTRTDDVENVKISPCALSAFAHHKKVINFSLNGFKFYRFITPHLFFLRAARRICRPLLLPHPASDLIKDGSED